MTEKEIDDTISLYEPKGRDMFIDYPELKEYEEFEKLSSREMRLCWLIGNRTSPIIKLQKLKRIQRAMVMVYGNDAINRKQSLQDMYNGKLPERIVKGVQRMAAFNPSFRFRAKMMNEFIFKQWEEIVYGTDVNNLDEDELKKYNDITVKITQEMPNVLRKIEDGFGIVKKVKAAKHDVKVNISDIEDEIYE